MACLLLVGCTETITDTVIETRVDTVLVTDTVASPAFVASFELVAEGVQPTLMVYTMAYTDG